MYPNEDKINQHLPHVHVRYNDLKGILLENYVLKILFKVKEEKAYDMEKLIEEKPYYSRLTEKEYFKKVKSRGETIE